MTYQTALVTEPYWASAESDNRNQVKETFMHQTARLLEPDIFNFNFFLKMENVI